ncbi:MAG TPA: hypothetical protein VFT50_02840 [Baekduia sp.]|nr:hypothetical protein [Baekduia sp.]
MSTSRHRRAHLPHARIHARDGALRRLAVLNRLAAVGAVVLVLGFTALAAQATPPRHQPAPVTAPTRSGDDAPATGTSGDDQAPAAGGDDAVPAARPHHRHRYDQAPVYTPAPAPTYQPPVIVSGGS